jgi:uncharacterized protein (DUF885 family)
MIRTRLCATACLALLMLAGSSSGSHAAAAAPASGAARDLAKLCDSYWKATLANHPTDATQIGDHCCDDRLEDITPAGTQRERQRLEQALASARAIDEQALTLPDRLTRSVLILEIQNGLDQISCGFDDWVVDPLGGPQVEFMNLADYTTIATPRDAKNFVSRCRAMGPYVDAHIANLTRGLAAGRVASQDAVRKSLEELDELLSRKEADWPLLRPLAAKHDDWPAKETQSFARDLPQVVSEVVRPAFVRYRDFLKTKIAPAARPQDKAGLAFLPGGKECYLKRIRIETSLDLTPEALHQLGLDEVAKFRRDLSELGGKVLGTTDVAEIQRKLRSDPAMHFKDAAEIEAKAEQSLAKAKAAIPNWFGTLPKADCVVKVMGMHEAPNSTIAYYRQPAKDGSRPGNYMINTYLPETRPRYEAEALAFHESIPGHHLQIAIAQELTGVPEFRKYTGVTAFVEGWGLYSERLANDMGLYSSDVDRIGMLSYDAWRACRLVVDTGMHYMGWSRQQAIDYMKENTVLAENNIVNEVDRYITWPGQALAYKCGQLEILRLRDEGKKRLGDRFDIKQFHDVVLKNGAVALPVLRQQVEAYYAEAERAK